MHLLKEEDEINLLEAAQDGKLDFIKDQLEHLINNESKKIQLQKALVKQDFYGRNALHYAAYKGHVDVIKYFLDLNSNDIKINCKDNQGNTPLMLACVRGYNAAPSELNDGSNRKFNICRLLLDKGGNIKMFTKEGINNPLHWTCYFSDILTTRLLVQKIPGLMLLKNDLGYYPIDHVLMTQKEVQDSKQDEKVAMYLILKFLVHFFDEQSFSGQLNELENHNSLPSKLEESKEMYQASMEDQVKPNQVDIQITVGKIKYKEISQQPIAPKRKSDKRFEAMGLRYLYWSAIMGREDLCQTLLRKGYSPFQRSYKGRNAIHAVAYQGHIHLLKLFFESELTQKMISSAGGKKKSVNIMTAERPETALHIAIQRGQKEVVLYLNQLGANPELHNFRNLTPFGSSRDSEFKKLKSQIIKEHLKKDKNLVRSGYKYVLVGRESSLYSDDLLFQQLLNIQEKNLESGRLKVLIFKNYLNEYTLLQQGSEEKIIAAPHNLIYYLIKVADQEKFLVYNLKEGFICRFLKECSDLYETFQHRHVQDIIIKLMNDEFDLEQFENDGIILDHFPLHDFEEVGSIRQFWSEERWTVLIEPFLTEKKPTRTLNALANYYGPQVGFYLLFLTFFTSWLLIPALPGLILGIYVQVTGQDDSAYIPLYIIFLAVWATIFFEFWKRKQNETEYELDMDITKEIKKKIPQFKGQFSIEDVTHEIVIVDKRSELWKYFKSVTPLIFLGTFLVGCQFALFNYLFQEYALNQEKYVISIFYAISICITNEIFYYFTKISLNYENHEFEDDKENVYILKAFSFTFFNCYIRLFYRSIIAPDQNELKMLTLCYTIVWAFINFMRYNILPTLIYGFIIKKIFKSDFRGFIYKQMKTQEIRQRRLYCLQQTKQGFTNQIKISDHTSLVERKHDLNSQIKLLEGIELTRIMLERQNFLNQFTYLIIQFGQVAMFSANFQLVPLIVMFTTWLDIECQIYSYVSFIKRPIAVPKKGIGLWNDILLVVGYIATVVNCLTIYTANEKQLINLVGQGEDPEKTALRNFLLLIAAEHIVLGAKFIIESVIPDVPDWVENARKRQEHLEEEWHARMKSFEQDHDNQMTQRKLKDQEEKEKIEMEQIE